MTPKGHQLHAVGQQRLDIPAECSAVPLRGFFRLKSFSSRTTGNEVLLWFGVFIHLRILTALVEPVEPVDVILAHLGGLSKGHVAVGNGHHGGLVVLGEGVPGESAVPHYMAA